jgi:cellulose synthase/poly-beta-1,6-N-acetylglucosamine synthase-like glycosyltransferase
MRQRYPAYEVIFAVDSAADPAVAVIEEVRREAAGRIATKLIVAGPADRESQKVHNLREAVRHVSSGTEIYVFVDSDARPAETWLRHLTAPLADEQIGAATGYRWFIAKKFGFAAEMRSAWNASIASALGPNAKNNFCWGGSTAIRRETFEALDLREQWSGTLSDDFAVTRAMKKAGLPIRFVPQALTASIERCTLRELFEFTTRQMKITRVYAPHLWRRVYLGAGLFCLVWIWGLTNLLIYPAGSSAFVSTVAALAFVTIFSVNKSRLRLRAARLVLVNYEAELKKQRWTQHTLWLLSPALYFYNCTAALVSRRIVWRGIGYELDSAEQTTINKDDTTN